MKDEADETTYPVSIRAGMRTKWLGRPLHYHPSVSSTNDLLAEMAAQDAPAGTLIVTDYQKQGKGRLGRRWLAPAGTSLLFSLLFRPNWPPEQAAWLTMLAGLAAVEAIESVTGLTASLKWPNDLILPAAGAWRKVGGLLLEGQFVAGRLHTAIMGIGINVNIRPDQFPAAASPATSLLIDSGRAFRREELLCQLLVSLEPGYEAAAGGQSPQVDWEKHLITLGRRVRVSQAKDGEPVTGVAESTDDWGRLLVRDDKGRQHTFSAGDVTLQVDNSRD